MAKTNPFSAHRKRLARRIRELEAAVNEDLKKEGLGYTAFKGTQNSWVSHPLLKDINDVETNLRQVLAKEVAWDDANKAMKPFEVIPEPGDW